LLLRSSPGERRPICHSSGPSDAIFFKTGDPTKNPAAFPVSSTNPFITVRALPSTGVLPHSILRMKHSLPLLAVTALTLLPVSVRGENEIGFIEKFALAADREQVLGQLIPGSEEFYFFHALHYQNTGQKEKLKAIMEQWAARFPNSAQRRIIENREALQGYDTDPKATIAFLKDRLHLEFNHQQEVRDKKPNLPTTLDQARISREVFERNAIAQAPDNLGQLGDGALEQLVRGKVKLTPPQRRAILARLTNPDLPGVVDLIEADLATKESRGFGEYAIHRALFPDQLDDLAKRVPVLLENQAFVNARLRKLLPGADVDVQVNPAEHEAWLDRLWAYAKNLSPAFNTLKAHILFQRLDFDRSRGVYDKARFLEYLKLPRNAGYVNPLYLKRVEGGHYVDFNADLSEVLIYPPIHDDGWLVRDYLLRLLKDEPSWETWTTYLRDTYVKPIFAESKIVNGVGNPEQWASLLTPAAFQALKERVDLDFSPANPQVFAPADAVSLNVSVKNVPKLIVRIYEINALTYYLTQNRQLNTDLNLDGLIANSERTHAFDDAAGQSPFRRTERPFDLPELKGKRGAWIVEFIGGGKSSRALIRKGQWEVLQDAGPAGDQLTVIDEAHQIVKDAVVWADGRRYAPNEKTGRIIVPFTNQPGQKPIVVASASGDFASLTTFQHHGEEYRLDAEFQVDREQLLAGRHATLAVRTALLLGDSFAPLELIEEPKLTIISKTLDGISSSREITAAQGLKLDAAKLYTTTLTVPDRVAELTVTLSGKVENLSTGGEKKDVSSSRSWQINGIDKTDATYAGHLLKSGPNYIFQLLGKDGEAEPNRRVVIQFKHHDFNPQIGIALSTDDNGRIALGTLTGIESLEASIPNRPNLHLALEQDASSRPSVIHAKSGSTISVPWMAADPLKRELVSLLEKRGETYVTDRFDALSLADGSLQIKGLAPGDYDLLLREGAERVTVPISVSGGVAVDRWIISEARHLQVRTPAPVQIESVAPGDDAVTIQLRNANPYTRVHVVADHFIPSLPIPSALNGFTRFAPAEGAPARRPNLFVSGRAIGDEYRYILDRRYSKIYPGNMLTRPGLLLNPWEVRSTDLAEQQLQQAEAFRRAAGDREAKPGAAPVPAAPPALEPAPASADVNLDFLAQPSPAIYNLVPDENGVVHIDRKALGDRHYLQVYAEDLSSAVWRYVALPEVAAKTRDLRLARNLDPQKAFTESKQITVLNPGQAITLADVLSADLETYDSLAGVHMLFSTLSNNPTLAKFAFVLNWPKLKEDEKRAKYSEFACHELNFFLSRKDPEFFKAVIEPYLRNKKDKTFMDEYLLGADLRRYLEPWQYGRLNVAERTLLARRLPGEEAATARHLRDLWSLVPPKPDVEDMLFETALRGRGLVEGGLNEEREKLGKDQLGRLPALAPAGPAAATSLAAARPMSAAAGLGGGNGPRDDFAKQEAVEGMVEGKRMRSMRKSLAEPEPAAAGKLAMDGENYFGMMTGTDAAGVRLLMRQFFRRIGPTKEWAENNYYQLPIANQNETLIPINGFWRDYAQWDGKSPFLSSHLAEASRNFSEMMLALGLLDLPFESPKHQTKSENGQYTLTSGGLLLAFHKEIVGAAPAAGQTELLVSENFFRQDDRYRMEDNERFDRYVTDEFLSGVVYGANVVVTNPTSTPQKIELLAQIPRGSLPVLGSKATDSKHLRLEPYTTQTLEYHFYFPAPGAEPFQHYPAHVSQNEKALGGAKQLAFKVVKQLSKVDTASWDYVSQYGTEADVLSYLDAHNLEQTDLTRVAWRARQSIDFFRKLVELMEKRHFYNDVVYSYAVVHNDRASLREWLRHHDDFLNQCGMYLDSTIARIDPIERRSYEHLEYSPLINQRIHRLGGENRIVNPVLRGQYQHLLHILSYKRTLDPMDQMSVVYYLFLQDRVEEALARLDTIAADALPTRIQYDYFHCYAAFYQEQLAAARGVASQYANYPVDRWRKLFRDVLSQLDEIEGKAAAPVQPNGEAKPDREVEQGELASTEPSFDFKIDNHQIALTWKNLSEVTINYYLMDPEFLFSSSPFVTQDPGRFSIVKPTKTATQALPAGRDTLTVPLPAEFERANVLIEILGAGQRKAEAYHANSLKLAVIENYGRLELRDSIAGKPVPKAYVKVYARLKNGQIRFYKDGYTDLRGKFDYASLNTGSEVVEPMPTPRAGAVPNASGFDYQMLRPRELGEVDRLSILVMSEEHGATVKEVGPPAE